MDLRLTWGQVAQATQGVMAHGDPAAAFSCFSTDSRRAAAGDVFWALKGARFDAHDFLDAQLARTAGGWIVRAGTALPSSLPPHVLTVPDTLTALGDLAAFHRGRFSIPVVGVTGTNGKTSVKDMLASILQVRGPVCANAGNFNNEIGLPLSVLELRDEHRAAVFEMGASHTGDIRKLCRIARPTVGVLTNIGPAHLEFFGSIEKVLATKTELIAELPAGAPVALNIDDPLLRRLLSELGARAVTYGAAADARVRVLPEAPSGTIRLSVDGSCVQTASGQGFGAIHRINAAAAAAAASALGIDSDDIRAGLEAFKPSPLRFARREHGSGAELTVDTYNANPASMRAGIETFIELSAKAKRLLVLGDMAELGPDAAAMHTELGRWLAERPTAGIFLIGPLMKHAAQALSEHGGASVTHADRPAELTAALRAALDGDTAVYFKASRAMRLEELCEAL
ncbi:MAG: UDP-N-acetylmuramoyl-tripeptide--D-alanyl-D-alanine ligase [Elusimicrobiota bacterium]